MKEVIKFLNHASFVVSNKNIRLISDPWLKGKAFNNGWKLLIDTPEVSSMVEEELAKATHIWISHEHPDHFSVPTLMTIPQEAREKITILFHESRDKRVIAFLEKSGFKKIIELKDKKKYHLDHNFSVVSQTHKHLDSWLLMEVNGKKLVNINDCGINSISQAKRVKKITGEIDVLLTQFSYANWVGNIDEVQRRKNNFDEHFEFIKAQTSVLKPKFVIPFASFIRFCHEENQSMNNGFPSIDRMMNAFSTLEVCDQVLMKPGQTWDLETKVDSTQSVDFYKEFENNKIELASLDRSEEHQEKNNFKVLESFASDYVKKIKKDNNTFFINILRWFGYFRPAIIKLTDLDMIVSLDIGEGLIKMKDIDSSQVDIEMASESLAFALRFQWGAETLYVNARYQIGKHERIFFRQFYISILNSCGYYFPFGVLYYVIKEKLLWRIGL